MCRYNNTGSDIAKSIRVVQEMHCVIVLKLDEEKLQTTESGL